MKIKLNKDLILEVNRSGTMFSKNYEPNKRRVKQITRDDKATIKLDPSSPRGQLNSTLRAIREEQQKHLTVAKDVNIIDPYIRRVNELRGDNSADIKRDHHLNQANHFKNLTRHVANNPELGLSSRKHELARATNKINDSYSYKNVAADMYDIHPTTATKINDYGAPYLGKTKINNDQSQPTTRVSYGAHGLLVPQHLSASLGTNLYQ